MICPCVEFMKRRKRGTIVVISSMAGLEPQMSAYSAAKSALSEYARNLRMKLAGHGIAVINVLPGWVATPMADKASSLSKTGMISCEEACTKIIRGVENNVGEIVFPNSLHIFSRVWQMIPFEFRKVILRYAVTSTPPELSEQAM